VLARRACSSAGSLARSVERRLALLAGAAMPAAVQGRLPLAALFGDEEPDGALGARGLADKEDERGSLEEVLRLARRAAAGGESKIAAIGRLLSRTREPAIIFTEYRDTLARLAAALDGPGVARLHGGLTARERIEAVRRFTAGDARLLLATDAGSEGLNLQHRCRLVINLELPWTPARLEQRVGRVDRIGQTRRVHAVHLLAAGSCEELTLARLARRMQRQHDALRQLGAPPDEHRVAESVLADRSLPEPGASALTMPQGVVTVELGSVARDEAWRISQARACCPENGDSSPASSPVLTRLRARRTPVGAARGIWLFKLALADASGGPVWDALVALGADLVAPRSRAAAVTRAVLDTNHTALTGLLQRTCEETRAHLQRSLREPVRRWCGREHDIVAELRARQARLSAAFLQRSLFDHRPERMAASQEAVLEEALSCCRSRLADLAARKEPHVDSCELVFAVLLS
jgi:hypothetical protein